MPEALKSIYPQCNVMTIQNIVNALSEIGAMTCFMCYPMEPKMGGALIDQLPKFTIRSPEDSTIERWREEIITTMKACLRLIQEAQERDKQ